MTNEGPGIDGPDAGAPRESGADSRSIVFAADGMKGGAAPSFAAGGDRRISTPIGVSR